MSKRLSKRQLEEIRQLLYSNYLSHKTIAEKYGVSPWRISTLASKWGLRRGRGPLSPAHPMFKKAVRNVI